MIRDEMMNVVATFPPANGQAAAKVRNEQSHQRVGNKMVSNASVAGVMGGEHDLVLWVLVESGDQGNSYPEEAQEGGRRQVPAAPQGEKRARKQASIAESLLAILGVSALIEALAGDAIV
jgi:hypothetical protein